MAKTAADSELRIVATNQRLGLISEKAIKRLGKLGNKATLQKMSGWPGQNWPVRSGDSPLVVVSSLADIPENPLLPSAEPKRFHLIFADGMPPEASTKLLSLKSKARNVHLASELGEDQERLLQRLIRGYVSPGASPILDAWWEWQNGGEFVVVSARDERLKIPAQRLTKWLGDNRVALDKFELDSDGSFVYWRHADAHFGWNQLRYLVDPASMAAAEQRCRLNDRRYGQAIKQTRLAHRLSQSSLSGLSEGHVRRVENGRAMATSKFLKAMAAAHEMPIEEYLDEVSRKLV